MKASKKFIKYSMFAFFGSMVFFSFVLALAGVFPFGNSTIIHGDLNNQYLALFAYLRENLLSGNLHRLFYSTSMNIGSGFFGVVTYYIMNPLNLMVVFFKSNQLPIFIELLTIFKIGLAGMSMFYFLQHSAILHFKNKNIMNNIAGVVMSVLYANMLFVFNYKECLMWLDGVIMLPLVVQSVEYIIVNKNIKAYVIALSLTIFFNYYIGVIVGFGAVFTYLLMSAIMWKNNDLKQKVNSARLFIMANVLIILLTSCILVPSFLSTSGIVQNHSFGFRPIYNPVYLISAFFNGVIKGDVPAVFVGGLPVFLCALFFIQKNIPIRIRITIFIAFFVLFASTCLDVTYLIWHVFTWPNGFPQRESFILSFYIIVLAYYTLEHIFTMNYAFEKRDIIVWIVFFVVFWGLHFIIGFTSQQAMMYTISAGLVVLALRLGNLKIGRLLWCLVFTFMCVDVLIADNNVQQSQNLGSSDYKAFEGYYNSVEEIVQNIAKREHGFYRIGNLFQITNNDPILFNYSGVSNYLSQQSSQLTNFMSNMGYYQNHTYDRWTNYNSGSTKSMDAFFGIKYVIGNNNNKFSDQILKINDITSGTQTKKINNYDVENKVGKFSIYGIKNTFPLVFKTNSSNLSAGIQANTTENPFKVQNKLFNDIGGKVQRNIFVGQKVTKSYDGKFEIHVLNSGEAYAFFPTLKNRDYNACEIYVNGNKVSKMFSGPGENGQSENGIIALGNYSRGSVLKLKIKTTEQIPGRYTVNSRPFIAVENQKNFDVLLHQVKQRSKVSRLKFKSDANITFETSSDFQGGNMIITLPVEKGWHARVDSKKVKINSGLGALMSIKVSQGHHTIELVYHTPGLFIGCMVTLITLFIVLIFNFRDKLLGEKSVLWRLFSSSRKIR